jgi:hypothetical protein
VGDGKSIQKWGDRWLPTPTTHRLQSTPRLLDGNSNVSCLIDTDTKAWKMELLSDLFSEVEVQAISNIPISLSLPMDRLVQNATSNGSFSVYSAYHLGKEIQQRSLGACSFSNTGLEIRKGLWSINVLNLVKVFMWKAEHNILPTKANLFKRRVVKDPICPCYKQEEESIVHALWTYPAAMDV